MTSENDLMMKLVTAKKIMTRHNEIGRGGQRIINENPSVEEFQTPNATYNLPEEFSNQPLLSESQIKQPQPLTSDRIMGSKLPDAIKQLMIEHPIAQPNSPLNGGTTISDELVEKASRLMGTTPNQPNTQPTPQRTINEQTTGVDMNQLKNLIEGVVRETVENVLRENGLIVESTTKTNEQFKFRVGNHMFEGKVNKIKKISE
jgi:hypothetical protein